MRVLILVEEAEGGFGAYAPDLPGCVAMGATREETERLMREAIEMHVEAIIKQGQPVPDLTTYATFIETAY